MNTLIGPRHSRQLTSIINNVNRINICWACLGPFDANGPMEANASGRTCSQDCEEWLWDVLFYRHLNDTHNLRRQWLWHVLNQPIHHTDILPSCGEHSNFFTCLFDTLNTKALQAMLDNPGNNKKA